MIFFNPQNSLLANSFFLLESKILKPLDNLSKKVAVIAIAIFSVIVSISLIYRFYQQGKQPHDIYQRDEDGNPLKVSSPINSPKKALEKGPLSSPLSTPLVSPARSVWKKVVPSFPTQKEAEMILSRNSIEDPLLGIFSSFDRQIRMRSKNPVSSEDFLSFYLNQIQASTQAEQNTIEGYLERINEKLKDYGIQLPEKIDFIRTTGREEIPGTAAYCRHEAVIFNHMSEQLLAHELFHIYSRSHPEMRKKLYALIGYHVIPPLSVPDSLKEKRIINPDLPYLDAYINVKYQGKSVQAIPLDLYDLNYQGRGKSYFRGIYHKFAMLEMQGNGEFQFKLDAKGFPILFDFEEAEDLQAQIGNNTSYIDSAEEILADNFAMMIMEWGGESPELIEKMKACFKETAS